MLIKKIASILSMAFLSSLIALAMTTFSASPANAATTCSSSAVIEGTPYITNYGSNYTNYPKLIYGGQKITWALPFTLGSIYTSNSGSSPTYHYETYSFPRPQIAETITKTLSLSYYDVASSTLKTCTIDASWKTPVFKVYEAQSFDSVTNLIDGFDGLSVSITGSKKFGVKESSVVTFTMKAKDGFGNNVSGEPKANGRLAFSINGFPYPYVVNISDGTGSIAVQNKYLYFDVFNGTDCNTYWSISNIFDWFGRTCTSNWYDSDTNIDFVSEATNKNVGWNRVSNVIFVSSNKNIWKDASNSPFGLNPNPFMQSNIYPWSVAGPDPIPSPKAWSYAVSNYATNKNMPGASYAGETTFADSSFSTTPASSSAFTPVSYFKCNEDITPGCSKKYAWSSNIWGNDINDEIASGIGSKTYILPNTVDVSGTYSTLPLVLSCPVNATGVKMRFIDWGQGTWNDAQYNTMRTNQDSIKFQVNSPYVGTKFFGYHPDWDKSPFTGLTFKWQPALSSATFDRLHLVYADVKNGKPYNWETGAGGVNPWSCVLPASARATAKIDYKMKVTNADLGLAVYTTTQRPVLQNLKIWNPSDLKRRVFAKTVTVQVFKNTGTAASPKKGAYVSGYDIPVKCLQYAGSTLSLPDARYSLGSGDILNTCKYDITLKAMTTVGKYVAVVKWDGKEGTIESYIPTDSWTTTGAQARFAFEVVQEFTCTFDDTGAESIWVNYVDNKGANKVSKGTPFTVVRSSGVGDGGNMLLTYPNVDADDFVGIIYDAPNIDAAMNGKIRGITKIYDAVLKNGTVVVSSPREPEELRLFKLDKVSEIFRNATNKYMFGDYEVLGIKKAVSKGATDELFYDNLRAYWPSTQNPVTGLRTPLIIEREINVYGWAWSMGKGGQLELRKDWHTCVDSPRTAPITVISGQVNQ